MNPILNIAVKAARRAGKTILRYHDRIDQIVVQRKGQNDFVSEVDHMAESDIVDTIHSSYPDHAIIAEERGGELATPRNNETDPEFEWIIDPIDGTTNFLHQHPHFAVSIAVRRHGQLQHAVILDPLRDELYTASRGQGAQLNERRIRVTRHATLEDSLLATGFMAGNPTNLDACIHTFKTLLLQASDIRRGGASVLDLAYVACGRLDGYWQSGLGPWDVAAGSLLIREAGGLIADYHGNQDFLANGQVVAANHLIFNELLKVVSGNAGPD